MRQVCARVGLVLPLVLLCGLSVGCHRFQKAPPAPPSRVVFQPPPGWDVRTAGRSWGEKEHGATARILSVSDTPLGDDDAEGVIGTIKDKFTSGGSKITGESKGTLAGHDATVWNFTGKTSGGKKSVKGQRYLVALDDEVASVTWYAPAADWTAAQPEMKKVMSTIRVH